MCTATRCDGESAASKLTIDTTRNSQNAAMATQLIRRSVDGSGSPSAASDSEARLLRSAFVAIAIHIGRAPENSAHFALTGQPNRSQIGLGFPRFTGGIHHRDTEGTEMRPRYLGSSLRDIAAMLRSSVPANQNPSPCLRASVVNPFFRRRPDLPSASLCPQCLCGEPFRSSEPAHHHSASPTPDAPARPWPPWGSARSERRQRPAAPATAFRSAGLH